MNGEHLPLDSHRESIYYECILGGAGAPAPTRPFTPPPPPAESCIASGAKSRLLLAASSFGLDTVFRPQHQHAIAPLQLGGQTIGPTVCASWASKGCEARGVWELVLVDGAELAETGKAWSGQGREGAGRGGQGRAGAGRSGQERAGAGRSGQQLTITQNMKQSTT